jgi:membrane protein involved in colicin uptake
MSAEEYAARKARQAEEMKAAKEAKAKQEAEKKAASEARAKYQKKADPTTVEDMLNAETLGQEWFKEGEWRAGWANVEFVSAPKEERGRRGEGEPDETS